MIASVLVEILPGPFSICLLLDLPCFLLLRILVNGPVLPLGLSPNPKPQNPKP